MNEAKDSWERKYAKPPTIGRRIRHSHPVRWFRKFALREPFHFSKLKLYWTILPYTMCSYERLNNAYSLALAAEKQGIGGAFVECGVYMGGCAALLAHAARQGVLGRETWLFDSFEGLPEPTAEDGVEAMVFSYDRSEGNLAAVDRCVGPMEKVRELLFNRMGLDEDRIRLVKGWFQETLPASRHSLGPIALLRLDGDWYESTKVCLEELYDNVVPGGYVIIDDYNRWEGCKRATDEFATARGLNLDLQRIDAAGVWFRKPDPSPRLPIPSPAKWALRPGDLRSAGRC